MRRDCIGKYILGKSIEEYTKSLITKQNTYISNFMRRAAFIQDIKKRVWFNLRNTKG